MKLLVIFTLATFSSLLVARGEHYKGAWKLLRGSVGVSAMHMALLPNDKIIAFDRTTFGTSNISLPDGKCLHSSQNGVPAVDCTAHSIEFDPGNRNVRPLTVLTDTWCSSGALSPEGNLLQSGGDKDGERVVRFFTPCHDCDWVESKNGLTMRRWYASNQILPNGKIIVVGGRDQFNYEFIPKTSIADGRAFVLPFLRETRDADENNLYPFLHLAPDENLFIFANNRAILLDYVNNRVMRNYPVMPGGESRNYPSAGSSVLLPIIVENQNVQAEVMICGGAPPNSYAMANNGTFLPASKSCGRLMITDESPNWVMEEMPMNRVMGDMILLPTGDVLIINGAAKGSCGWDAGREPVMNPVLYRTGITGGISRHFEVLKPSTIPRMYHSTAHLIPDGRILVGGSNPHEKYEFSGVLFPTDLSLEAFWPPYLKPGSDRPTITSIKPDLDILYNQRFSVGFKTKMNIRKGVHVTMVAPSFTTHSFSMNQRLLVLKLGGLRQVSRGAYEVEGFAPTTAALAPPGYYLLFVVHDGVPSRGKWVHIN